VNGSANIRAMLLEIRPVILSEIDFLKEARNAEQFRKAMKRISWVQVPRIIKATADSLVMECIRGTKIDEVRESDSPVPLAVLAIRLSACFMLQLIRTGMFHGDCHSRNISLTAGGNFVIYDLGAMISLGAFPRSYFDSIIIAFLKTTPNWHLSVWPGLGY
jgi:ubiquinone biosynthesis protein